MKDRLLILGAGGHGKVVADAAQLQGQWAHIAFLDDAPPAARVLDLPVIGGSHEAAGLRERFNHAIVAIGDAERRLALLTELAGLDFTIPVVRHPSAVVSPHATIGRGTVLFAHSAVNPGSRLGQGCIVNTGARIDHDCMLDDGVHIAPGATLAGDVHVGRASWIGVGASVREGIRIGEQSTVGAGAAVVGDIGAHQTVVGVPAGPLNGPQAG